jgi:large repetitive protein
MEENLDTGQPPKKRSALRRIGSSTMAFSVLLSQVTPALATIDNTATASGTYNAGTTTSNPSTVNVTVTPAAPSIQAFSKSASPPTTGLGPNATVTDAGDTITFTYVIKNNGNVTLNNVLPTDIGPTFNGTAGTPANLSAFTPTTPANVLPITLAPGAQQTYTAVYTLTALDAYRGAGTTPLVANSANATGKTPAPGNVTVNSTTPATATAIIAPGPSLTIAKTSSTPGPVAVGNTVTYTYTVTNNGNVPITGVKISDTHELVAITPQSAMLEQVAPLGGAGGGTPGPLGAGASTDTTAGDGIWTTLAPGATVIFKYTHTVTQAEFDAG